MTRLKSKHKQNSKRSANRRFGATAVEFAFVAPVLLAVIFSSFEFSRLAMMRSLAQSAAYEAARDVIVEGSTSEEATNEANRILARLATKEAIVTINDDTAITPTTQEVHVLVQIPMEKNMFLYTSWFTGKYVSAEITLRTERYTGYYDGSAPTP